MPQESAPQSGQTVAVDTWAAFERHLTQLREHHPGTTMSPLLFRGQADARWSLSTTLERSPAGQMRVIDYFRIISRIKTELESFTDKSFEGPDLPTLEGKFSEYDSGSMEFLMNGISSYGYLAHVRHHGFPSPLLDWSRSPYIAAFFAFRAAVRANCVAIYAFIERPTNMKSGSSTRPSITGLGPHVRTHRRHFLQQCEYTVCMGFDGAWRFVDHEIVLKNPEEGQDLLWKFIVPGSERSKVLRLLDSHNLNAFSLFGSEETLMDMLAERIFDYR